MKNFKFKSNSIYNFIKRNISAKKIDIFSEKMRNQVNIYNLKKNIIDGYNSFYKKRFKVNYFIFFLSLIIFYYLIYLSFPGITHNKSDQAYFTNLLKKKIWSRICYIT